MLDTCFSIRPNERKRRPKSTQLDAAPRGSRFEDRAFAVLLANADVLGIKKLSRCHAARHDGILETRDGEIVLLEMKECLGWGAFQAASTEFLMGKHLLEVEAQRAIIVFERVSSEWEKIQPYGAWGQLALHAQEMAPYLQIGGLQVMPDGSLRTAPP